MDFRRRLFSCMKFDHSENSSPGFPCNKRRNVQSYRKETQLAVSRVSSYKKFDEDSENEAETRD